MTIRDTERIPGKVELTRPSTRRASTGTRHVASRSRRAVQEASTADLLMGVADDREQARVTDDAHRH